MHAVEKELLEATGYKPQRKFSNRQDYLGSVLNAVLKLRDEEFDDLTDEAAEWANAAVQAKNARNQDLPDFDEVESSDEESENEDGGSDDSEEPDPEPVDTDDPVDEEPSVDAQVDHEDAEKPKPTKRIKIPKKPKATKAAPKAKKAPEPVDEEDVVLDKWGAMDGSKNSRALALFEKGATTKEVKDQIGGTYYNILKKMSEKGHKVEKEGSLIKLTHKDELAKRTTKKK
jgi:outer membrane biosynthesis protein TonB